MGERQSAEGTRPTVTELVSRGQQRAMEWPWLSPLTPGDLSHLQHTQVLTHSPRDSLPQVRC